MHIRRFLIAIPVAVLAVSAVLLASGCEQQDGASQQRKESVEMRADTFDRAETLLPVPMTENFPLREELIRFTERQDMVAHPTYIYVLADTGQVLGYYVAKTFPVNVCAFLSSTEDVYEDSDGNLLMTAPSLDGIYYGGGGASSNCNGWFFFDQQTDALIELIGVKLFIADQPLSIEAEPFIVEAVN